MAKTTNAESTPPRKWPRPIRILVSRPRLILSFVTGFVVAGVVRQFLGELREVTHFLLAWDLSVALYLILAFWMMAHCSVGEIRRQALIQDEGGFAILVLTIVAAAASVGAVISWLELASREETFAPAGLTFLLITIMLSWAFIHTMFALHYAHEYYGERGKIGGLIFPRDREPDYWDFVYLAFSIGTSTEVSDVEISSKRIRRAATMHGIVAFFFNVTLIALSVGLVGDAIQN